MSLLRSVLALLLALGVSLATAYRFRETETSDPDASVDRVHDLVEVIYTSLDPKTGRGAVLFLALWLHAFVLFFAVPSVTRTPWLVYASCTVALLVTEAISWVLYTPPRPFATGPVAPWVEKLVHTGPVLLHPGSPVVWKVLLMSTLRFVSRDRLYLAVWSLYLVAAVFFSFALGRASSPLLALHLLAAWVVPPCVRDAARCLRDARWPCVPARGRYTAVPAPAKAPARPVALLDLGAFRQSGALPDMPSAREPRRPHAARDTTVAAERQEPPVPAPTDAALMEELEDYVGQS
jgi:hypothetical protein